MKFIVDTQLPPRLSTYLKEKGYDSIHTTHFEEVIATFGEGSNMVVFNREEVIGY